MELLCDNELIIRLIVESKRDIETYLRAAYAGEFVGNGKHFALAKTYATLLSLENSSRLSLRMPVNTYTPPWVIYEHQQHLKRVKAARNNAKR